MIRTFEQSKVEELAEYASIPVINGLTDFSHPCQVLADLMTIREHYSSLEGLKAAYIGDGNNMANSIIVGCLKSGMDISIGCPDAYRPAREVIDFAETVPNRKLVITSDIMEAAKDADVIFTDVWASMGMEGEKEKRIHDFSGYCVDEKLMSAAKLGCMVMHCLTAHRGEEISEGVFEAHAGEIFEEAENRLHAQKAVMVLLMKDKH